MRRFEIVQSETDTTTSHSGLALVGRALGLTRLGADLDDNIALRHGIAHSACVASYVGIVCTGKSDFEAIENRRNAASYQSSFFVSRARSSSVKGGRGGRGTTGFGGSSIKSGPGGGTCGLGAGAMAAGLAAGAGMDCAFAGAAVACGAETGFAAAGFGASTFGAAAAFGCFLAFGLRWISDTGEH